MLPDVPVACLKGQVTWPRAIIVYQTSEHSDGGVRRVQVKGRRRSEFASTDRTILRGEPDSVGCYRLRVRRGGQPLPLLTYGWLLTSALISEFSVLSLTESKWTESARSGRLCENNGREVLSVSS